MGKQNTLVCFPIQLHFIRLHSLLYGFTDVTKADINTCTLQKQRRNRSYHWITVKTNTNYNHFTE